MTRYNTILVDDEPKSTDILSYLLTRHCPELEVVGIFNKPTEGLEFIKQQSIDLLLLDIQMPEMDGFQLLDALLVIDFDIVFITAYDDYALKAFRYYAIDYLLKPVSAGELKGLVNRLQKSERSKYNKSDYIQIMKIMATQNDQFQHLAVPTSKGVEFVRFDDIIRLEADSNYTNIIRKTGDHVYASKTLKHFESLLPATQFFRPHQSHIINGKCIQRYIKGDGGSIQMEDGKEITLSRSKRQEFMERFGL